MNIIPVWGNAIPNAIIKQTETNVKPIMQDDIPDVAILHIECS